MKYYHSSTIFLRFSFPLTQFRSLQGKNLFIPQHWEHLATEAKVANASLTLTWSTSFHPVGPSLSFTPSLLTFPSKGGNLPLPWRLCSNLSSISPRSFPLSLSPSSLSSPLLFRTHDLPTPSNVRGHGYTRLCFLGAVQPAWKGPEAEGEGEEPVVNQNRRSSESPSHLFESVRGPARGFVPAKCAHLDIFPASRRVNNHRGADRLDQRPSVHDDDGDTRCGQSGSATRWVRSRVSRKPVDERYPVSIATFLRDIVPKNRYRAATKFRDATTRRRIIGSMDGYTRHLRLIFFDVFRDGIFMISRAMNICTGFLSWDSDSLTDLRAPCLFFFLLYTDEWESRASVTRY